MPQIFDNVPLTGTRLTQDGYLIADVKAGRVGIQQYAGVEVDRPDLDVVRVYRSEEEVFKDEAMASFTSLPVTIDHPPSLVSAKTWRHFAVGFTGESVARDGGYIRVPLALKDADAISRVTTGDKRELSFGYTCDLDFTAGKTADGKEYDAIQRNIRGNHLAIVSAGRAGRDCRIGDGSLEGNKMLKQITVDGIPVETTDAGATVVKTLQDRIAEHVASNLKLTVDHKAALATKDAEIATLTAKLVDKDKETGAKDAEIATLKAQVSDATKIDALVAERSDVITKAKALDASFDPAGKTNADIRKVVVQKALGDAAVVNRSDDYIMASFDRLVEMRGTQPSYGSQTNDAFRQTMQTAPVLDRDNGRTTEFQKLLADQAKAWQTTGNA
jgi:hypothetical protein